jgi:hypothetical protein
MGRTEALEALAKHIAHRLVDKVQAEEFVHEIGVRAALGTWVIMVVLGHARWALAMVKKGRPSFLKKRSKKLFPVLRALPASPRRQDESLVRLFFKEEVLPSH